MTREKSFKLFCEIMRLVEGMVPGNVSIVSKDGHKIIVRVDIERKVTLLYVCEDGEKEEAG